VAGDSNRDRLEQYIPKELLASWKAPAARALVQANAAW
jgi:hypothetical protein